jgi:hypothetical protein
MITDLERIQRMIAELDVALHGKTWARDKAPVQVWRELLAEVRSLVKEVGVLTEEKRQR